MSIPSLADSILQAVLCILAIAAFRLAVIHLGAKITAIVMGLPFIMFPMLVVQAWYGPAITSRQTIGSVASMTAVAAALWLLRLPVAYGPAAAVFVMTASWGVLIAAIYATALPAELLSTALLANTLPIVVLYRNYRPTITRTGGNFFDGAIPITIFLILFFVTARFIPDFIRGVYVSAPIGLFATLYFVRSMLTADGFRAFIIYTQGSMLAGVVFVSVVHFGLQQMPIAATLTVAILASLAACVLVAAAWRAPRPII